MDSALTFGGRFNAWVNSCLSCTSLGQTATPCSTARSARTCGLAGPARRAAVRLSLVIFVPEDETCLLVYEAASVESGGAAAPDLAGLPVEHIVEAIVVYLDGRCRLALSDAPTLHVLLTRTPSGTSTRCIGSVGAVRITARRRGSRAGDVRPGSQATPVDPESQRDRLPHASASKHIRQPLPRRIGARGDTRAVRGRGGYRRR